MVWYGMVSTHLARVLVVDVHDHVVVVRVVLPVSLLTQQGRRLRLGQGPPRDNS